MYTYIEVTINIGPHTHVAIYLSIYGSIYLPTYMCIRIYKLLYIYNPILTSPSDPELDQRGVSDYLRVNSEVLSKTLSYPNPKGSPPRKLPLGRWL